MRGGLERTGLQRKVPSTYPLLKPKVFPQPPQNLKAKITF